MLIVLLTVVVNVIFEPAGCCSNYTYLSCRNNNHSDVIVVVTVRF